MPEVTNLRPSTAAGAKVFSPLAIALVEGRRRAHWYRPGTPDSLGVRQPKVLCPGSGWQLIASQGKRGAAGEKGERGPRGDAGASGATIVGWKIDRERYVATPIMSDGSDGPPLELRGLFEQFFSETIK
jgi:hypothetical protein